jgi:hypothetical protein
MVSETLNPLSSSAGICWRVACSHHHQPRIFKEARLETNQASWESVGELLGLVGDIDLGKVERDALVLCSDSDGRCSGVASCGGGGGGDGGSSIQAKVRTAVAPTHAGPSDSLNPYSLGAMVTASVCEYATGGGGVCVRVEWKRARAKRLGDKFCEPLDRPALQVAR